MKTKNGSVPQYFWQKPLGKKPGLILAASVGAAFILFQAWRGRERLFLARDGRFRLAFISFSVGFAILFAALAVIGAQARKPKYRESFNLLRLSMGVLSFFGFVLVDVFGHFASSSLNASYLSDSVAVAMIIAVWNAMSMKPPVK